MFANSYLDFGDTKEISLDLQGSIAFSPNAVARVQRWIETFPSGLSALPKKPLVDFVNWELYLEKKRDGFEALNKFLADIVDFYEFLDLFKAAKYLQVEDLISVISAKIAFQISNDPL